MRIIADWLLSKSTAFKIFLGKYSIHKKNTENSFKKVKRDNILIANKLKEHENKIKNLQRMIEQLIMEKEEPIKIYKKK